MIFLSYRKDSPYLDCVTGKRYSSSTSTRVSLFGGFPRRRNGFPFWVSIVTKLHWSLINASVSTLVPFGKNGWLALSILTDWNQLFQKGV